MTPARLVDQAVRDARLNMSKHQRCQQSVDYSCFRFDSFRGLMQCQDEKVALLRTHTADLSSSSDVSDLLHMWCSFGEKAIVRV